MIKKLTLIEKTQNYFVSVRAITSISILTSFGNLLTWKAALAGKGSGKYSE